MTTQSKNISGLLLILTLGFTFACGGGDKAKANKAVSESNALGTEYIKIMQDSETKSAQLSAGTLDVEGRQKNESTVKEILNSLGTAKAKASEAAQKMEDASKFDLEDWHKEYLSTQGQMYRKASEQMDLSMEALKTYMDYSLDEEAFTQKFTGLQAQVAESEKELEALNAKAKKIQEAHKDQFQQ